MPKSSDKLKQQVAQTALEYLTERVIIGVGTGRTANCFIDALAQRKHLIEACVASSLETERRLKAQGFVVLDLPTVDSIEWYFDGADEVNPQHQMIKGGGGAMTREKIVATVAKRFVCMIETHKWVSELGQFPIAVEVLPMARSLVGRAIVDLGGDPVYRQGFVTDNGNIILDTYHWPAEKFPHLEQDLKQIPGVVESGLFWQRRADIVLCAGDEGVLSQHL
jgi:ribose 5-phosphate isomerase A